MLIMRENIFFFLVKVVVLLSMKGLIEYTNRCWMMRKSSKDAICSQFSHSLKEDPSSIKRGE